MPGLNDLLGYMAICIGFHYLQQISMLSCDNPQGLFTMSCATNIGMESVCGHGWRVWEVMDITSVTYLNFYKWKHV